MAEPTIELDAADSATPTTYNRSIIAAGSVVANIVIRWGDGDSVSNTITNVTLPSSGNAWAPELWFEDTGGTDYLICDTDEQPDGTQRAMMYQLSTTDDENFATAPRITVYDDSGRTIAEEFIAGSTGHTSPFIKARGQTVSTAPAIYWGEASDAALHVLNNESAIVCGDNVSNQENCALEGDTGYLYTSTTNLYSGSEEYFSLAASIPDDAATGVDVVDGILSIRYTYT